MGQVTPMQFHPVQWHDRLPSTNSYLVERLADEPRLASGTVVAARCQTAGRGRHARSWQSTPGRDLAFSFVLRAAVPPEWLPSLPMAASLGVAAALDAFGIAPLLKWPNDVLVGGRKLCGILSEFVHGGNETAETHTAVVGIGVNVNMNESEARAIDRPATSMRIETGREWPVEGVLEAVLDALPPPLTAWEQHGFAGIREAWLRRTLPAGQSLSVSEGGQRRTGRLRGFGPHGELLLMDAAGAEHTVVLGDVDLA
jgi:BirA family transcriptional regulator, biotin operon repressor / biotin---[acetyl-CoA-carboxylase] ligase